MTTPLSMLDRQPWNRFHTLIVVLLGVGWLLDAFEVTLANNIVGVVRQLWNLSGFEASWILSIWFVGLMIGAALFGYLSDRIGRRKLFLYTLVFYGVATLATAFADNLWTLLALRLLTAIGVGGEYGAVNAAISEFVPAAYRGRASATVMNFWSVGGILAGGLAYFALNAFPAAVGWRLTFGFGALIAMSTIVLRRYLPESPRWLQSQGREREAGAVVKAIGAGRRYHPQPENGHFVDPPKAGFFVHCRQLLRDHPGRLALGAVLDFSEAAGYYGLFAFLPLFILPAIHVTNTFVPMFYLIGNVGALAGGLLVAWLLDKAGRRTTVAAFYALAGLGVIGVAVTAHSGDWRWVLAAFTLANLFATGSWIGAYPTFTELFPTHLRGTGVGLSVAFGRIGAFAAPLILTAIGAAFGLTPALGTLAGFWGIGFIAMLAWRIFGIEGAGRSLEELAPHPAKNAGSA